MVLCSEVNSLYSVVMQPEKYTVRATFGTNVHLVQNIQAGILQVNSVIAQFAYLIIVVNIVETLSCMVEGFDFKQGNKNAGKWPNCT